MAFLRTRRQDRRAIVAAMTLAVFAPLAAPRSVAGQPAAALENDVKAAFLYNFARYITWPAPAFESASAPVRLCVLADPDFVASVDTIVRGENIDNRPVTRLSPNTAEEARSCHLLYVAASHLERAQPMMTRLGDSPVLAVSDAPKALDRGYGIMFVRENDRVRFDVDLGRTQGRSLTISSRLLRVARRVVPNAEPR